MSFVPVFFSQPISFPMITFLIKLLLLIFLRLRFVEVAFTVMVTYLRILFNDEVFMFTSYHVIGIRAPAMLTEEKELALLGNIKIIRDIDSLFGIMTFKDVMFYKTVLYSSLVFISNTNSSLFPLFRSYTFATK